ncbi:SDR family NAD(P)-dependent oxidoreductase [Geomonas sp. RF6]|uniref:SDR family NAD(P)-dependent oxidoreductase n=1 Tax=Geomonas sp. RF6 TaxID=2897342 RepID=UPI001E5DC46F|nr:SDR family NAD(P)-dependent oxidoreductase [Geomonas sp. RF6]UFS68958.1 SDR family NAD(P)-dependent oxidoreductase [Geomonas sp. RF6]
MKKAMKLAVVSGGSRGLGAEICAEYVRGGFEVVEFSRSAPHSFSVRADFSDPVAASGIISEKLTMLAGNDYDEIVIVSNAGLISPIGPAPQKDRKHVLNNINVNFTTAILFICEAVRLFQERPGKKTVAHTTSGAAQKAYAGLSLYCAAKAGMENFIRSLSAEQEREPNPFQVISIDPGVMDTDMQADIRASSATEFPSLDRFLELKKFEQLPQPRHIAAAIFRIIGRNNRTGVRYVASDFLE